MAEQKKRGFHALEQRIHEMEAEDAKREGQASEERKPMTSGQEQEKGGKQGQKK